MRAVSGPGRWVWGLSGLATAVLLAVPGLRLAAHVGAVNQRVRPSQTITRTISVTQPITRLDVRSEDGPVLVRAGSGHTVHGTEYISYDEADGPPTPVRESISGGHLSLADPVCADNGSCSVDFMLTVPATVAATVTSNGAPVSLAGLAGATVDSGGAPVTLKDISGPATVGTDGGWLDLTSLTGALHADTGGGPLSARYIHGPATITTDGGSLSVDGLTGALQADSGGGPATVGDDFATTATVITGGGSGQVTFRTLPTAVTLSTDGAPAALTVPAGSYALDTDSDGGPESVSIATDPSASRTLTVTSGGGPLSVSQGGGGL